MSDAKPNVKIVKINNTYGHVICDDYGTMESLYKRFSVPVDNYWFMPKYKAGVWDGKIHFVSETGRFYNGLLSKILKFFGDEYNIELDEEYKRTYPDVADLKREFVEYTDKTLTVLDPYVYQWRGALKALYHGRAICEHGTGSGKSYTITMIVNYLLYKNPKHKVIILVPKLDLIEQFYEDMIKYGIDGKLIGKFCGHQKDTEPPIIVSTWQSIHKKPEFLKEFTVFIADECLHPNTLISMGDGSFKKIKDICVGDFVWTLNETTKKKEIKPVIKLHHNISINEKMYEIEFENGKTIKITGNHKIYTKNRGWVRADELTTEDDIETME